MFHSRLGSPASFSSTPVPKSQSMKTTTHIKHDVSTFFDTIQKINSKWIKDLNLRPDTIKFLGENIGRTLSDKNHSSIFFDLSSKVVEIKINRCDLSKLKSFCSSKETIYKMKTQHTESEKIFVDNMTDNGLVYIYKQFMQLHIKIIIIIKKWTETYRHTSPKMTVDGQEAHEKILTIPNY